SAGSSSRERSSVRVAAITVQAAQWPIRLRSRPARAVCIARENAWIRAPIDSRARSILLARAISPPVGGWIFDRFGDYAGMYLASRAVRLGAVAIPLTFSPFPRTRPERLKRA